MTTKDMARKDGRIYSVGRCDVGRHFFNNTPSVIKNLLWRCHGRNRWRIYSLLQHGSGTMAMWVKMAKKVERHATPI